MKSSKDCENETIPRTPKQSESRSSSVYHRKQSNPTHTMTKLFETTKNFKI